MGRITYLVGMMLCVCTGTAQGQADDLLTILQLALENDPTLNRAEAQYLANRENVALARANLLPSLSASGTTSRVTSGPTESQYFPIIDEENGAVEDIFRVDDHSFRPGLNTHNWGVNLNQSIFNLAAWYNLESSKDSDRAAAANLAAEEQNLIMRVSAAYFDVLRAAELLETRVQEEEAAMRSLEQTRQREEVGLDTITDVYDQQSAFDFARNQTILQQDILRGAYEALEALTGRSHTRVEALSEEFPIVDVDGSLEEWEEQAEENSLAILAAAYNLDASRDGLRARKSEHLPTVSLSGGFRHQVTPDIVQGGVTTRSGKTDGTSLSLTLSIPLYSGGATISRRRAAEYQVLAARESLELAERQLTQNVRNAYRRVNTDVLVISQRLQAIQSAESALEATELGFELGQRNIVEVLRARENLYRALRDYADARFNYVIDTLTLKQVSGLLTPADIIDLNQWLQGVAVEAQ